MNDKESVSIIDIMIAVVVDQVVKDIQPILDLLPKELGCEDESDDE